MRPSAPFVIMVTNASHIVESETFVKVRLSSNHVPSTVLMSKTYYYIKMWRKAKMVFCANLHHLLWLFHIGITAM